MMDGKEEMSVDLVARAFKMYLSKCIRLNVGKQISYPTATLHAHAPVCCLIPRWARTLWHPNDLAFVESFKKHVRRPRPAQFFQLNSFA